MTTEHTWNRKKRKNYYLIYKQQECEKDSNNMKNQWGGFSAGPETHTKSGLKIK
jgi:hypothetical protein